MPPVSLVATVSLRELADLAIGTPEAGAVNFTALHTLIVAMLRSLHLLEERIPFQAPGADLQPRSPLPARPSISAPQLPGAKEKKRSLGRAAGPPALEGQVKDLGGQVHELSRQLRNMESQVQGIVAHVQHLTAQAAELGVDPREWLDDKDLTPLVIHRPHLGSVKVLKDAPEATGLLQDVLKDVKTLKEAHLKARASSEMIPQKVMERIEILEKFIKDRDQFLEQMGRKLSSISDGEDATMVTWEELEQAITDGWKSSRAASETLTGVSKHRGQIPIPSADRLQREPPPQHPSADISGSAGGLDPDKISGPSSSGYPSEGSLGRDRSRDSSTAGILGREQHPWTHDEAGMPRPHHPSVPQYRIDSDHHRSREPDSSAHPRRDEQDALPGPVQQDVTSAKDQPGVVYPDQQGGVYLSQDQVYPGLEQHGLRPPGMEQHVLVPFGMGQQGFVPLGMDQQSLVPLDIYQQGLVPLGRDQKGLVVYGMDQHALILSGMDLQGMVSPGMGQRQLIPSLMDQHGLLLPSLRQAGVDQQSYEQLSLEAPGLLKPSTEQYDLVQFGAEQRTLVQPGPSHTGLVQPAADQRGLVQAGIDQRGLVQPGAARRGLAQSGADLRGLAQLGTDQRGLTQPGTAQRGLAQPAADQRGLVQPGADQHGLLQPGIDQHGLVQPGADQHGLVQPGADQHGMVPPSADQHGLVEPSVGQEGLVQAGADQHGLLQPGVYAPGLVKTGVGQLGLVQPGADRRGLIQSRIDQHGVLQPGLYSLGLVQPGIDQRGLVQRGIVPASVDHSGLGQPGADQRGLAQPGTYPPGFVPPGAYPPSVAQPRTYPSGFVQPGAYRPALVQPGAEQHSLVQPGDQRGLVQPSAYSPGVAQPGAGQQGLVQPGIDQRGLIQPGAYSPREAQPRADQSGMVLPGVVQHGLVQPEAEQHGLLQPGADQPGLVQPGLDQHDLVQSGADRHSLVQPGSYSPLVAQPGADQRGLMQPGIDQRGLVQPRVDQRGLVQPGAGQRGLVQPGAGQRHLVPLNLEQGGLVQPGAYSPAQPGAEQHGMVQPVAYPPSLVQPSADQHSLGQLGTDQHGLVQLGAYQHGLVQSGADQRGMVQPDAIQHGLVQPGAAQQGMVQPVAYPSSLAQPGVDQRGLVQPGAGQHSMMQPVHYPSGMVQPGTDQRGLVQPVAYPPSLVQTGAGQFGLVQPGMDQSVWAQAGTDQRGLAQPGAYTPDLVQPGIYPPVLLQPDAYQPGLVQAGTYPRGLVQAGAYPRGLVQPDVYSHGRVESGADKYKLVQPGMDQHGLAQPGADQHGLAQPGADQPSLAQPGADQDGLVQPGTDQHGLAQPDADQHALVQPGAGQHGLVQPGTDQQRDTDHHALVQHSAGQHGLVQPSEDQHGLVHPSADQHGLVQPGMAQHGLVQPGVAQRGLVQPGMVQRGLVQPGMVQRGLVQPGMVQRGFLQPSADQHGLVPGRINQQVLTPLRPELRVYPPQHIDSRSLISSRPYQQGLVTPGRDQYIQASPLVANQQFASPRIDEESLVPPEMYQPGLVQHGIDQHGLRPLHTGLGFTHPDQQQVVSPGLGQHGQEDSGPEDHGSRHPSTDQLHQEGSASYGIDQPQFPAQTGSSQDSTFVYKTSSEKMEAQGERHDSLDKLAPNFPIAVETFRLMGELVGLYLELKEQMKDLDEEQAGHTDLEKIKYLLALLVEKTLPPDLPEHLKSIKTLAKEVRQEKAKLDRLQRILEGEGLRETGKEMKAGQLSLQLGILRVTVADIEKELAELRESQERGKVTMEHSVSEASLYLQDQLDKLRTIIESMLASSSTLLTLSMPPSKTHPTLRPGQIDPEATCPACSLDLSHQVSTLVQRYEQLQDMVNNLAASRPSKKAKLQSQDEELLGRVQSAILQVQGDCERLAVTTSGLIADHRQKQRDINVLYQGLEKLEREKANREHLETEIDVKADKSALAAKVSRVQFDATTEQLNHMMRELVARMSGREQDWQTMLDKLLAAMDSKLDRLELEPVKQLLEDRWKSLRQQLKERSPLYQADEAAAMRRQLLAHFHCLSCDRPLETPLTGQVIPAMPVGPGLPGHRSTRPYTVFELEQVRQQSRNLKLGGPLPRGDLSQMERSVGRLRSAHSKMLTAIEKVQIHFGGSVKASSQMIHELLQAQCLGPPCYRRMTDMADYSYSSVPRRCGGSHTLTYPYRRNRLQHLSPGLLPAEETQAAMKHDEVDILGLDGHIYKGRMDTRLPGIVCKDTPGLAKHKAKQSRPHGHRQQSLSDNHQLLSRPQSAQLLAGNNPASLRQHKDRPVSSEVLLSQPNVAHPPSPTEMTTLTARNPPALNMHLDVPPREGLEDPTRGPRSNTAH